MLRQASLAKLDAFNAGTSATAGGAGSGDKSHAAEEKKRPTEQIRRFPYAIADEHDKRQLMLASKHQSFHMEQLLPRANARGKPLRCA
eukprot:7603320-Alexandrium_andersonii.AAC.1